MAHIYTFVPLVMNEHENQGAKMIRMFMCDLSDLEIHITCSLIKQQKKSKKILVSGGREVQKAENPHLTPPLQNHPSPRIDKAQTRQPLMPAQQMSLASTNNLAPLLPSFTSLRMIAPPFNDPFCTSSGDMVDSGFKKVLWSFGTCFLDQPKAQMRRQIII